MRCLSAAISLDSYLFANKLPVSAERIADCFQKLGRFSAGQNVTETACDG